MDTIEKNKLIAEIKTYAVTGALHGSIVEANTEMEARALFKEHYGGEPILNVKDISHYNLENL